MPPDLTKLATRATGYKVGIARRIGDISADPRTGPAAYGEWEWPQGFYAATIIESMAPEVHKAKVIFQAPATGEDAKWCWPWQWREHFALDDRLVIVRNEPPTADRHAPFAGFIVDVDYEFDTGSAMTITAMSAAWRLKRDTAIFGRLMFNHDEDGQVDLFTGMECVFNAGGRPNRSVTSSDFAHHTHTFTPDGAGRFWQPADIIDYLWTHYNYWEPWGELDVTWEDWAYKDTGEVNVEGKSLWDALAILADRSGADCWEHIAADAAGEPQSTVRFLARRSGRLRTVRHQPPARADELLPILDAEQTNLYAASLAESNAGAVTAPVVLGGRDVHEITVELHPAWLISTEPGDAMTDAHDIILPDEAGSHTDALYLRRYVRGGRDFPWYFHTYRLWDANTDGKYSSALVGGNPIPDIAALAGRGGRGSEELWDPTGEAEEVRPLSWPEMPYKPLATLSFELQLARGDPSRRLPPLVEIQWTPADDWAPLAGCQVLPERLGVLITAPNLAAIVPPDAQVSATNNLFYRCWLGTRPKIRLTCCVESPYRMWYRPSFTPPDGGSAFRTRAVFDRGNLGRSFVRGPGSEMAAHGTIYPEDDRLTVTAFRRAGQMIAEAVRYGSVEASLAIEWPDEDIRLSDRIERIEGIEVRLTVGRGQAAPAPRVIARTMNLTPANYSMSIALETPRKAGLA